MWTKSFVATTVAIGGTVDDALMAIAPRGLAPPTSSGAAAHDDLVAKLRAPQRAVRAAALAGAVHDIVIAIDKATLR